MISKVESVRWMTRLRPRWEIYEVWTQASRIVYVVVVLYCRYAKSWMDDDELGGPEGGGILGRAKLPSTGFNGRLASEVGGGEAAC